MYTVNNRVLAHAGWALCLCRDVSCRSFSYSLLHKSSAPPCRRSLALRYRSTALTTPYTINPATSNQLLFHFQPVSAPPLSIRQTPIRPFTRLNADNPPKHPKIRVKREKDQDSNRKMRACRGNALSSLSVLAPLCARHPLKLPRLYFSSIQTTVCCQL